MKIHFSCFELITDINIYKIRVIIFKKAYLSTKSIKISQKTLEKRYLLAYTEIVENAA